jgi:ESS family glutamate:Na+ symporter
MANWDLIIYFLLIGILLFVGKILKKNVPFLNRIVLPTALLGGVIGLLLSNVFIPGSYQIDVDVMTAIVYHALALGFISLTLKRTKTDNKKKVWSTGMLITSTYALQGFIGILMVLIFFSDKFVGAGMLLPLGFGQGPGLATSFGRMWTDMLNGYGVALGASYAFIGFVFGGTIGVLAINILSRKKGIEKTKRYWDDSIQKTTIEIDTVKEISVLDGLTVQVVIIFLIYGLVWLTLFLLEGVLLNLGNIGQTIFNLLSGFNFILGIGYALIYKQIIKKIEKKGKNLNFMTNDYILSNISSLCFNFMITGAVLTITIDFLSEFGWLLISITAVGGFISLFYIRYLTKRVYDNYQDEYFVGLFGMLTGVASTGIALLKGLDRNLETPVAEELVLGSGTAITMALPLFGFLMLPSLGYGQSFESLFELIALFGCLAYVIVMFVILMYRSKKNTVSKKE